MPHLILFDIDGTLLLAPGAGKTAFEKAYFEIFQVPNVWKKMNAHGRTDRDIIDEICKESLEREITKKEQIELEERFSLYFASEIEQTESFQLMPGIPTLLETLSAQEDVYIGIETGNLERTAQSKLKRGSIEHYFSFGGFSSDARERADIVRIGIEKGCEQHQLSRDEITVTVIGDSVNDVHAGLTNNAHVIAVATGGVELSTFRAIHKDVIACETLEDAAPKLLALAKPHTS